MILHLSVRSRYEECTQAEYEKLMEKFADRFGKGAGRYGSIDKTKIFHSGTSCGMILKNIVGGGGFGSV